MGHAKSGLPMVLCVARLTIDTFYTHELSDQNCGNSRSGEKPHSGASMVCDDVNQEVNLLSWGVFLHVAGVVVELYI